MQRTNSEIRKQARQALEGNWGKAVLAMLIVLLITEVVPAPFQFVTDNPLTQSMPQLIVALLCLPLYWGFDVFILRIVRAERVQLSNLFDGYKDFWRIFLASLLYAVYVLLWTLLLIVPGIIKSLSYAMMPYVLKDNPEMGGEEAIHRSRVLMDGHKMKLFLLYLSFIGWAILCLLTLGIGFLLLAPYVDASKAAFYESLLKEEKEKMAQEPAAAASDFDFNVADDPQAPADTKDVDFEESDSDE